MSTTLERTGAPSVLTELPPLLRPTPDALACAAAALARRPALWQPLVAFDPAERFALFLGRTEMYEAWLLTWLPGQRTGLHDHGESAGAVAIVHGSLQERTVRIGRRGQAVVRDRVLGAGQVRPFGDSYIHDIGSAGTPSVSLHVYGPELAAMTRYQLEGDRLTVLTREVAGSDW